MTMEPHEAYAALMLRPLADEEYPPSTIDVGRAMAEGRRGLRRRRVVAATAMTSDCR